MVRIKELVGAIKEELCCKERSGTGIAVWRHRCEGNWNWNCVRSFENGLNLEKSIDMGGAI